MKRWLYLIAGLAVAFVAVRSVVQAVRQGSWGPVISVGWVSVEEEATWPGTYRRCLPRRNRQAGAS